MGHHTQTSQLHGQCFANGANASASFFFFVVVFDCLLVFLFLKTGFQFETSSGLSLPSAEVHACTSMPGSLLKKQNRKQKLSFPEKVS